MTGHFCAVATAVVVGAAPLAAPLSTAHTGHFADPSASDESQHRAATDGYMGPEELAAALHELAAGHDGCTVEVIGESREGRPIHALTLSGDPATAGERSALLITAGLDARHRVGPETAFRVARNLLTNHADALDDVTVYVIPLVNPDGVMVNVEGPNAGHVGTATPVDNDRDGADDEDGPVDLNGDGVITTMRRIDPPLDDPPTHMADPAEPRLLKTPDPLEGERATYTVYVEGRDQDGDGLIAEDALGHVDLDHNFMQAWPEHDDDAGRYPLSEPESHSLAKFVLNHRNIVAAITYGRHDNLINVPDGRGADITGRGPKSIDADDVALYKAIAEIFKDATGQKRAPSSDLAGAFHHWLYAQRGLPSFATVVWGRPDVEEPKQEDGAEEKQEKDEAAPKPPADPGVTGAWSGTIDIPEMGAMDFTFNLEQAADNSVDGTFTTSMFSITVEGDVDPASGAIELSGSAGEGATVTFTLTRQDDELLGSATGPEGEAVDISATRTGGEEPPASAAGGRKPQGGKAADADAEGWLKYSDQQRGGAGFVEWTPYDHPTLGEVEIGGFVPGFQMNPPAASLDDLASKQAAFAVELINRRPQLDVEGPVVTQLADGLYDVRFAIVNDGFLPTMTSQARKSRANLPIVVRLSTPIERIVSGDRVSRAWGVDGSGGRFDHHWIIRVKNGSKQSIEIVNPQFGDRTVTFVAK